MNINRKTCSLIAAISQSKARKHISLCSYSDSGSSSFFRFLPYVAPEVFLNMFYLFNFRVGIYFSKDNINLFKFKINNVIHHTLSQSNMFFIQIIVKFSLICKWIVDITIQVNCQKTATVVWA